MYSHTTVGTNDLDRARRFYEAVMPTLGLGTPFPLPETLIYGTMNGPKLLVVTPFDKTAAAPGNGTHIAFAADSRATVDAFHAAAIANGGTDDGAPGLRPRYHPNYYGAYVRDPDGNKLQAVCHRADG